MRHLNYTHLMYFWNVAREGSVAAAAEVLHLTPQTISGQLKLLEEAVGEPLFTRVGRGLVLTETGQVVREYADEIFTLGAELTQRVKSSQALVYRTLNVGILSSLPKLVALRVLEPAMKMEESIHISCREDELENLLGDLAVHKLDLVLSDRPIPPGMNVKAYNHELGTSRISLFAHRSIARRYKNKFPQSLNGAPMLLPDPGNPLRRMLTSWFEEVQVEPEVVAEISDSALLKAFGEAALGIYPAPTAMAIEISQMYHSVELGLAGAISENYFAISPERKLKHPAVLEIMQQARNVVFR